MKNSVSVAFIGFGEVGRTFAGGFRMTPGVSLAAYDILLDDPVRGEPLRQAAGPLDVTLREAAAGAAAGADIVFSAVTASDVMTVAEEAAGYIRAGQFFVDVNSASPNTKKAAAALIEAKGGRYVEAAVMAPVRRRASPCRSLPADRMRRRRPICSIRWAWRSRRSPPNSAAPRR